MPTKVICLSLPPELIKIIDEAAKAHYCSRSDYIRQSVLQRLERAQAIKNSEA